MHKLYEAFYSGNAAFSTFTRVLRKASKQIQAFQKAHEEAERRRWMDYWSKVTGIHTDRKKE